MQIHPGNCVGGKGVAYWVDILLHEKFMNNAKLQKLMMQRYKNEQCNITKIEEIFC